MKYAFIYTDTNNIKTNSIIGEDIEFIGEPETEGRFFKYTLKLISERAKKTYSVNFNI